MPEGYIELTEAITQTIKLWFGEKFTIDLASVESLRKELTLPTKQRRDRRWNFVRSYYRRAFIQKRLKTYFIEKNILTSLHHSYWKEWLSSLDFGIVSLGKPEITIFVLNLKEWELWHKECTNKLAIQVNRKHSRFSFSQQFNPTTEQPGVEPVFKHIDLPLPQNKSSGPKCVLRSALVKKIYEALDNKTLSYEELRDEKIIAFATRFNAKSDTANKARKFVINELQIINSNKQQTTTNSKK